MRHYLAVNSYRSSTSEGFSNTWTYYQCRSRKQQQEVLERGLPVSDVCYQNRDTGERSPMYSNLGIRLMSDKERKISDIMPCWIEELFL